jgi:hypothetical protein
MSRNRKAGGAEVISKMGHETGYMKEPISGSRREIDRRATAQSEHKMERCASFQLIFRGSFVIGPAVR